MAKPFKGLGGRMACLSKSVTGSPHVVHRATRRDVKLMKAKFNIRTRMPNVPPSREDGQQVGAMRHRTREALVSRGLPYIAGEAELVVSELVTNAIVHSGGRKITLTLSLRGSFLRITVCDGGRGYTLSPDPPDAADEHGRGLILVQAIADERGGSWGVTDAGSTTWCELDLAVG
ncbi:ATP-binding protein [Streptomyces sp. NPDC045456]|uniref:ATP-binding protein n=1 Tax=Streptomyces sp. NPDC045456 TaxID=3155254 RepID=UPI0034088989